MINYPRIVLCYHGCLEPFASDIISGKIEISDWAPSRERFDWLGQGVYFWEHAPARAWEWAQEKAKQKGGAPAIIGAVVQLDRCFDLTESRFTDQLAAHFPNVQNALAAKGLTLPENRGRDSDLKLRFRDCIVINDLLDSWPKRRRLPASAARSSKAGRRMKVQ